jgi:hypothetical protein
LMRHCSAPDPLDRLWHSCAWRRVPWTGAGVPPFRLSKRPVWHFVDGLALAVELCGLRGRAALPDIVAANILERLDLDRDSYFWGYIAALDLAKRHSSATSQPLRIFRLSRVLSWERGTFPQLVASDQSREPLPSVIRLTIDNDGLLKIERLTERPKFCRERFDNLAFVVEEESRFGVAIAQLKVTCWSAVACFRVSSNKPLPARPSQLVGAPGRPRRPRPGLCGLGYAHTTRPRQLSRRIKLVTVRASFSHRRSDHHHWSYILPSKGKVLGNPRALQESAIGDEHIRNHPRPPSARRRLHLGLCSVAS